MLTALITFAAAAALLIVAPGPDSTLVLRNAIRGGRPIGLFTAAGTLTGLLSWTVAAALGLSALIQASQLGYDVLRYAGGAYLVWLGLSSLLAHRVEEEGFEEASTAGVPSGLTSYLAGTTSNLLNPKIGVFFITFLPGFIPRGVCVGPTSLMLGTLFVIETSVWLLVVVLIAGRSLEWLRRPGVRRRVEQVSGVLLIGFGVRLALLR